MIAIGTKTRLQLKVFAPALMVAAYYVVHTIVYWGRPDPLPPYVLLSLVYLYIGVIYVAAPGRLVLAVASRKRNYSLRTWRLIGIAAIALACLFMARGVHDLLAPIL